MPADSHDDRSSEDKPLSSDARRFVVRRLATQRANGEPVGTCQVRFAAKNLGMPRRTFFAKKKQYGLGLRGTDAAADPSAGQKPSSDRRSASRPA